MTRIAAAAHFKDDNERAVATTNRNFRGRMGSRESEVCLANAWVAAAAAVAGELVDPADVLEGVPA